MKKMREINNKIINLFTNIFSWLDNKMRAALTVSFPFLYRLTNKRIFRFFTPKRINMLVLSLLSLTLPICIVLCLIILVKSLLLHPLVFLVNLIIVIYAIHVIKKNKAITKILLSIILFYGEYKLNRNYCIIAIKYFKQSIKIGEATSLYTSVAAAYRGLAVAYDGLSESENAHYYIQKSLDIQRNLKDTQGYAISLFVLAHIYGNLAEHERAIETCKHVLDNYEDIIGMEKKSRTLSLLGYLYSSLNKYEEAEKYYTQARALSTSDLIVYDPEGEFRALIGLASQPQTEYQRSLERAKSALVIAEDIQDAAYQQVSLSLLGFAYYNMKQYEQAIECHEKSLKIAKSLQFSRKEVIELLNLGKIYWCCKTDDRASLYFQKALEIAPPNTMPIECYQSARSLGYLEFAQGNWKNAIEAYTKAIDSVEILRTKAQTDDRREQIMSEAINTYQYLVQAYINVGEYQCALETVERSKARNLVELFARRDLYPKGNISYEIGEQLDRLRRIIPSLERQLQVDLPPVSGNKTRQQPKQLEQKLRESREQLDRVLNQIKLIDPNFSLTQKVDPIPFQDIQSLIDERTAIIEWYLMGDKILTFIVTAYDRKPMVASSSLDNLEALENWNREYLNAYREQKSQWITNLSTRLAELAKILDIDRILDQIEAIFDRQGTQCDRLILVPHRYLHLFPLHALPLSSSNEELLLDRFARGISYAPSSQLLKLTKQQHRPDFKNLFAIQNPTRLEEKPLLGSKLEVDRIRQYFDPNDSIILAEAEATEVNLNQNQEQLRSAHCLHFSCHGKFNFESPLESALLLSDPEGKLKADADLTLYKIFKLDLSQCRIVGFSACESGMTLSGNQENADLPSGLDEYIGLPSGFLYAGSPSVVSTLWTVDPLATALLVIKFYKNLKRLPTLGDGDVSTALVQAQYWLRSLSSQKLERIQKSQGFKLLIAQIFEHNKRERGKFNDLLYAAIKRQPYPFAKPYYWAGSVATGT